MGFDMKSGQGITIEDRNGTVYLIGPLNEYGDLSSILSKPAPLTLNLRSITRINSIGIRNFLKFLSGWGDKPLRYEDCTVEFIDQVNMIPSLLGIKQHADISSLEIPYECTGCDLEDVTLTSYSDAVNYLKSETFPKPTCQSCGSVMVPVIDTYFSFVKK
jgi:hypothetical protein